jgi:hypothetical protein
MILLMFISNTYLEFLQFSFGYSISLGNNWDDIYFGI